MYVNVRNLSNPVVVENLLLFASENDMRDSALDKPCWDRIRPRVVTRL